MPSGCDINHREAHAMSIAEIERFVADLKSNEALRAEVEKAQAETSMVAFAVTKGYTFTADEVKAYAKAMVKAAGKEHR